MAYLELAGLEKRYRDAVAVADVTLAVEKGESVALLGPSGCGKTTTLRMLAGLIVPERGRISVDGADITEVPAHKRNMGYVFQSYALFPHMNVEKNVAFGLEERGVAANERKERVATALGKVRLNELAHRRPRELSGGQQQRVALARALVIRPSVLLLDESLSNLDAKLRQTMRREIRDLQRSLAITTLFVTHDQVEALAMCDRIAVMNRGRIEQVGTPSEVYERPATRFVASFVGSVNVLPADRDTNGSLAVWGTQIPGVKPAGRRDGCLRPAAAHASCRCVRAGRLRHAAAERQGRAEHLYRRPGRNHRVRSGRPGDGAKSLRRGDALRRNGGEGRLARARYAGVPAGGLMTSSARWPLLAVPAVLLLAFIYLWPSLGLFRTAFNETSATGAMIEALSLKVWREMMADSFTYELTLNSLWLSVTATSIALCIAYPISLFLFRTESRFRGLLAVMAIMPMLVSGVVRIFGWLTILGDQGMVNSAARWLGLISTPMHLLFNWTGVTIGLAESILPYMILALLAGFGRLDRALEEASRSLGAPPWRTFLRVTLPLSLPAIVLAAGLGFVLSMSAYITPKLLGGGRVFVLATEIFEHATTNANWPMASAMALFTLALMLAFLALANFLSGRLAQ